MTTFVMYGAIAVVHLIGRALRALTSSHPVLTPECEDGPAAGDAAGPTNFHHP